MVITYKELRENSDYILIGVKCNLLFLAFKFQELRIHPELQEIIFNMYHKLYEFEKEEKEYLDDVAIRKDSLIGRYIINHKDGKHVINESLYIDFKKIANAFNIAILEENDQMIHLLYPIFKNKKENTYEELKKQYSEEALSYILEHDSLEEYIGNIGKFENSVQTEYIIYENNQYSKKFLKK